MISINQYQKHKGYYSKYYRDRYRKKHGLVEVKKTCEICHIEFTTFDKRKRFCSKPCQKKFEGRNYIISWYKKLKENLIKEMGGKCQKCGYNRCNKALEIHHVNGEGKDKIRETSMGHLTKETYKKIIQLWKEGKAKLLCANCHREEDEKP